MKTNDELIGVRVIAGFVLMLVLGCLPVLGNDFSGEELDKAVALVAQLDADKFAEREAAMKELESLPAVALPWLEERIGETGPLDIELRSRLKSIVRTLKRRDAEQSLKGGTQVKVDLKGVSGIEVMAALSEQIGAKLASADARGFWEDVGEKDFVFEGTFWEGVEAMMEAFPAKAGGREDLVAEYRMVRWGKADFQAAAGPGDSSGIMRVRHARMALENNGGKDYVVVTLVPTVEPCYQVESLALLVRGLKLEDGTVLKPEKKTREWKAEYSGSRYSPGGVFTWTFPLEEKGVKLGRVAGIEGVAEVRVRKLLWCEAELPEDLNVPAELSSTVEIQVLERGEKRLKIQFEGKGAEPASFDDYQLRKEAYEVLDAAGEKLEFRVNNSSSGGGSGGWKNSYGGKVDGEPAKVRAQLPMGEQRVELRFELGGLPVPGAGLREG